MDIHILGLNHQIQSTRIGSSSTGGELERFERGQKEQFDILLQKKIDEFAVEFVGEEARHGWDSIAHAVCVAKDCRYANIEIPPDERAARRIPTDYESDADFSEADKMRFHEQREDFMYQEAINEAGNAKCILVICGRFHTSRIGRKFSDAGHTVYEEDIQREEWYVEDWMTHMMRL
jgi:hypothetical protein